MFQTRMKIVLEYHGFKKYTRKVKFNPETTTFVYIIRNVDKAHIHTTPDPLRYIKRYHSWKNVGNTERLPVPVQRLLPFKQTSRPASYLDLYYKQNCGSLQKLEKSISYVTEPIVRSPIDRTGLTNIIEIRVSEDPEFYYLVRYNSRRGKYSALAHFTYRSLKNLGPNPKSKSQRYIDWSIRNQKQILAKDYIVKDIVVNRPLDDGVEILREYLKDIKGTNLKLWNYV